MMHRFSLVALAVFTIVMAALPVAAAEEIVVDDIDISAHPQITIRVTMPPALAGQALPADAFTVTEGGTAIVPVVERLPNEDLEVVLLLDTSQSMRGEPLAAAIAAAESFAGSMPSEVRIAVVSFATSSEVVTDFVAPVDVPTALATLSATGETSLYDGLETAAGLWSGAAPSRRALVLLTDGGDTVSVASLEDAIVSVIGAGSEFYAVALESPEADDEALRRLEAATGGSLVAADDPDALASIFGEIAGTLVSRYELRYVSAGEGTTDIGVGVTFGGVSAAADLSVSLPIAPVFSPEAVRPRPEIAPTVRDAGPVVTSVADPGWMGRRELVVGGAALIFVGLFGAIRLLQTSANGTTRQRVRARAAPSGTERAVSTLADRATAFAERRLNRGGGGTGLSGSLERAGSALRAGEYVVVSLSFALVAAAVGVVLGGTVMGAVFGMAGIGGAVFWLQVRVQRRQSAFADQLGDALLLIAGGLQAGHGIIQSCDAVATENLEPASDEFRRLIAETRLGRDFVDALRALGDRVGGDDFRWVVDAIEIHREVGGDLSEVLRSLAATIRSRNQVRRRVQALSAEGKLSGVVLMALPFVVGAFVTVSNPGYLNELFTTRPGQIMVAGAATMMIAGGLWIRRIVTFDY